MKMNKVLLKNGFVDLTQLPLVYKFYVQTDVSIPSLLLCFLIKILLKN